MDACLCIRKKNGTTSRKLPPVLREYADLQKDVVLVGVLSRVEIWDKGRWLENTYDEDEMDGIAEHMAELGFSI